MPYLWLFSCRHIQCMPEQPAAYYYYWTSDKDTYLLHSVREHIDTSEIQNNRSQWAHRSSYAIRFMPKIGKHQQQKKQKQSLMSIQYYSMLFNECPMPRRRPGWKTNQADVAYTTTTNHTDRFVHRKSQVGHCLSVWGGWPVVHIVQWLCFLSCCKPCLRFSVRYSDSYAKISIWSMGNWCTSRYSVVCAVRLLYGHILYAPARASAQRKLITPPSPFFQWRNIQRPDQKCKGD